MATIHILFVNKRLLFNLDKGGNSIKMRNLKVVSIIIVVIMCVLCTNAYADRAAVVRWVDSAISNGAITHVEYATYYVNGIAWRMMTAQDKEMFARACAIHYKDTGGGAERSEIKDSHSGKKLAKYGAFGAKLY